MIYLSPFYYIRNHNLDAENVDPHILSYKRPISGMFIFKGPYRPYCFEAGGGPDLLQGDFNNLYAGLPSDYEEVFSKGAECVKVSNFSFNLRPTTLPSGFKNKLFRELGVISRKHKRDLSLKPKFGLLPIQILLFLVVASIFALKATKFSRVGRPITVIGQGENKVRPFVSLVSDDDSRVFFWK